MGVGINMYLNPQVWNFDIVKVMEQFLNFYTESVFFLMTVVPKKNYSFF